MRTTIGALFCVIAISGCGESEEQLPRGDTAKGEVDTLASSEATARLDQLMSQMGLSTEAGYRLLDTTDRTVAITPPVPGPSDEVKLLVVLGYAVINECGVSAEAWVSSDGWASKATVKGTIASVHEATAFGFDLPSSTAGAVEVAVRVDRCFGDEWSTYTWLKDRFVNYSYPVYPASGVSFVGNQRGWVDGLPLDQGSIFGGHDAAITVQTYPKTSGVNARLHYELDGGVENILPMKFDIDGAGEHGNNLQWVASLPAGQLAQGTKIAYWITVQDAAGETFEIDNNGAKFGAEVVQPKVVSWADAGRFVFTKFAMECKTRLYADKDYYNWCYFDDLKDEFVADYDEYQAYANWSHLAVELYAPGVTDSVDPDYVEGVAKQFLKVELYSDIFSGTPGGAWSGRPMAFATRRGNNFIYEFELYCPGPSVCGVGRVPNGTYNYKLRASADSGATWFWVGSSTGGNRTLKWNFSSY